jgi:hypothetical protein
MKKKHLKWDTLRIVLNSRKVIKLKNTNVPAVEIMQAGI